MAAPPVDPPAGTMRRLRIAPRAAALTIVADVTVDDAYRVTWTGPEPRVREDDETIEVGYTVAGRVRAALARRGSLTLALDPAVAWDLELRGGVAGLRADLRDLRVQGLVITGGATDLVVDLPRPDGELPLRIDGGVSRAGVRRPADVPVRLHVDRGVAELALDDARYGAIGGTVRMRTGGDAPGTEEIALRVGGGASELSVGPYVRRAARDGRQAPRGAGRCPGAAPPRAPRAGD